MAQRRALVQVTGTVKELPTGDYSEVPAGAVADFGMNTAPSGWLKCNGAAVSRTTYAALFAAIGTGFGVGDGSTTFNVPELRGEFRRGWDDSRGVDSGRGFGSAQAEMIGPHYHSLTTYIGLLGSGGYTQPGGTGWNGVSATNNNSGTENRPRNIALLACIKY